MKRRVAGAILLSWLVAAPCAVHAAIAFGARTQVWPFLYQPDGPGAHRLTPDERLKRDVTEGNLARYAEVGARWNIVEAWQGLDGPDGFVRLDQVFAAHEGRGIQVALRVLEDPGIYDAIRGGGDGAERALARYGRWVGQLAARYGTRARYYMISNEVDHDVGFNRTVYAKFRPVSVDEYGRLLRTAHAAVKGVDGDLVVADHGVSAYSLALAVMADHALSGRPAEALAFWRAMDYRNPGEGERTMPRLLAMLAAGESRHRIEFAGRSTTELAPFRDVFQLHHYHGPTVLPDVLRWVRARLGAAATQPLVAAEVGCLIPTRPGKSWDGRPMNVADMARYSEADHGDALVKSLAVLAGSGVEDILYWQLRFHVARDPVASLFPPSGERDGFRAGYPARAFGFLARELTGATAMGSAPGTAGATEYRFRRDGELSVVWSAAGEPVTMPAALRARVARVTDATGAAVGPGTWDGRIGTAPLIVYWQQ